MKKYIYLLLFVLLLNFGLSDSFTIDYDPYVDLDTQTTITLYANETITSSPVMVFETDYTYLNTTDNKTFTVSLLSDIEDVFDFTIYEESNESVPFFGYETLTGEIDITDDTVYLVHSEKRTNGIISHDPRQILICPKLHTDGTDRTIKYYVGVKNGTDADPGLHDWDSLTFTKNYEDITTSCEYLSLPIPYANYTLHAGIQCLDCNHGLKLYLGIGGDIKNASHYYDGDNFENASEYPDLNYDLGISMHDEYLADVFNPIDGTISFTEKYNVNIEFINDKNLTEELPYYDYVYLQKVNDEVGIESTLDDILTFSWIDKVLGFEDIDNIDQTLSFWSKLNNNVGDVSLYETGNYTINLIKAKVYDPTYWTPEFLYPQNKEFSYSKNIATLEIKEKSDKNIEIHLDAYEINKTAFAFNTIRNIFIVAIYFACIIAIGLLSKSAWVTGAIGTITLPIVLKLMGL